MIPANSEQEGHEGRPENSKQRVYRLLKADIVRGVFDMGQRLNEGQLAAQYGVSKTPVREALVLLQQEGLVEVQPRIGYLTSQVTLQDVDDIFDLRQIVEGAAAQKAATRVTEGTLQQLERLHSGYCSGDRDSYLQFLDENFEFHCTIARASGNRQLAEVTARLLEQMQRLVILRLDLSASGEDMVHEHGEILAALRRRDPTSARELMINSIANTHQAVLDSLKKLMANRHI